MKDQYYGDINDYRKYGLLRSLADGGTFPIGVFWMLTPDDGRSDGGHIGYLNDPDRWRRFDPALYDRLRRDLLKKRQRKVCRAKASNLIPGASFHALEIPTCGSDRLKFFEQVRRKLAACPLIFFDPDNGLEVKSVKFGTKNSPKYVYLRELAAAHDEEHSLLIYQHYPRRERSDYDRYCVAEIARRMGKSAIYAVKTPEVVYFLVVRPEHTVAVNKGLTLVRNNWEGQLEVVSAPQP